MSAQHAGPCQRAVCGAASPVRPVWRGGCAPHRPRLRPPAARLQVVLWGAVCGGRVKRAGDPHVDDVVKRRAVGRPVEVGNSARAVGWCAQGQAGCGALWELPTHAAAALDTPRRCTALPGRLTRGARGQRGLEPAAAQLRKRRASGSWPTAQQACAAAGSGCMQCIIGATVCPRPRLDQDAGKQAVPGQPQAAGQHRRRGLKQKVKQVARGAHDACR